ncbi:MAG: hypothetical protein WEA09_01285 [Gemmatimonadota bacterium]
MAGLSGEPTAPLGKLWAILGVRLYRRFVLGSAVIYLGLFMVALQDISLGGNGVRFLTTDLGRMFHRTGTMTFEPIAQLTLPGITFLLSPLNLLMGAFIALLVGLNLGVTLLAFRNPGACRFNRSSGVLASLPALLAGSACCAPAVVLILGLQLSAAMVTVFQLLIPVSVILLLTTLKLILDRTEMSPQYL